jgi:hypothetical protein
VAFTRQEPTILPGDYAPSDTKKTYIYIHDRGGYYDAINMPVRQNYEFDINVGPPPSDTAELRAEVLEVPFDGPSPMLTRKPEENKVHVTLPLSPSDINFVFDWNKVPGEENNRLIEFINRIYPNLPNRSPFSKPNLLSTSLFTQGEIRKIDNDNTIQIGPNCQTVPIQLGPTGFGTTTLCATTLVKLDNSRSHAMVIFKVSAPINPSHFQYPIYNHVWRYPLIAKTEDGRLNIFDYDHNQSIRYGAVVVTGWREPILTQDYRVLKVTVDSIRIRNNHAYQICSPSGAFGLPTCNPDPSAKWNMWANIGGSWIKLPGLDNVHNDEIIQFNDQASVTVIVPESGNIRLKSTTGWKSGGIDDPGIFFVRTEPPTDIGGFFDFLFNCFDELPNLICSNLPIGVAFDRLHGSADNFGIGMPHSILSRRHAENAPGQETNFDFAIRYHIDEISRFNRGTITGKDVTATITLRDIQITDTHPPFYGYVCEGSEQNCRLDDSAAIKLHVKVDVTTEFDIGTRYQEADFPASGTLEIPLDQMVPVNINGTEPNPYFISIHLTQPHILHFEITLNDTNKRIPPADPDTVYTCQPPPEPIEFVLSSGFPTEGSATVDSISSEIPGCALEPLPEIQASYAIWGGMSPQGLHRAISSSYYGEYFTITYDINLTS